MKTVVKRITMLVVVAGIFSAVVCVLAFSMLTNAEEYALKSINAHLYDNGVLTKAGEIQDRNGIKIAYTQDGERQYCDNSSTRAALLHIIGDNAGFIDGGLQDKFRNELSGYNIVYGVNKESENVLNLSLDSELCAFAYEQLRPYKGCIAVCNYKTGELLCIASSPSYDMFDKPEDIDTNDNYEGVYINRLFGGLYTPGSIFKLVTSVCAIENIDDIFTQTFECTGSYNTGAGTVICHDIHGTVDFKQALVYSCNCAFSNIAVQLGSEKIAHTFTSLGLDSSNESPDRILYTSGKYKTTTESTLGEIGWSGIGQDKTLVNPYSYLAFVCAIANNGKSYKPYFVSSVTNENGKNTYTAESVLSSATISETTAKTLKEMMRSTVKDYYGDYRFGDLTMCGKTGTAEVDNKEPHSWFVGFSYDEEFPYAIVTVIENRGSGLQYAATAASEVLQELYNKN